MSVQFSVVRYNVRSILCLFDIMSVRYYVVRYVVHPCCSVPLQFMKSTFSGVTATDVSASASLRRMQWAVI